MLVRQIGRILVAITLCLLVVGTTTTAFGQGRGRGGGGGRGSSGGVGHGGGAPAGVGVDRGLSKASERSDGRSDRGLARASENSKGRSDKGLERARIASNNLRRADEDLRNHPGIARTLHTNANDLRAGYRAALATNPNLKFGHYVAATRLAQNLGSRHPGITRSAILAGLASGKSLGQTLQSLGLSERAATKARNQADREIKRGRK